MAYPANSEKKKLIEAGQAKYKNTPIKRQTYTTAVSLTN